MVTPPIATVPGIARVFENEETDGDARSWGTEASLLYSLLSLTPAIRWIEFRNFKMQEMIYRSILNRCSHQKKEAYRLCCILYFGAHLWVGSDDHIYETRLDVMTDRRGETDPPSHNEKATPSSAV